MLQKLGYLIEQLHLSGMADSLKSVLAEARHQGQSIEEVLQKLLEIEYQYTLSLIFSLIMGIVSFCLQSLCVRFGLCIHGC